MAESSNFCGIHVEILLSETSLLSRDEAIKFAKKWLPSRITCDASYTEFDEYSQEITQISIYNCGYQQNGENPEIHYHVYCFHSSAPEIQGFESEEQQISTQWILPTKDFHGLWESLYYDSRVKDQLLNYVATALKFSEKCVDPNIVSWNRIVLLHGPPGTGKTSLCKALAQKISIRFSSKYTYGALIEVNTHSLFSKWFSESGKLVSKMFHNIVDLVEDPKVQVIVLLDEVETLACSRSSALNGNEPSDALRVVNAFLTHLDMIKRYPNVLILTTSNITDAIDVALIDRADIRQYIGLPSAQAIYEIYCSCIKELQKTGIICTDNILLPLHKLEDETNDDGDSLHKKSLSKAWSARLKVISEESIGLSGRSLRKIPFVACSLFIQTSVVTLDVFLDALSSAVQKHWDDVKHLKVPK